MTKEPQSQYPPGTPWLKEEGRQQVHTMLLVGYKPFVTQIDVLHDQLAG